jgi:excisionase family DNA binding protein
MANQKTARRSPEKPGAFTVPEAALYLRLSKSTIDRMLRTGGLRRIKIGNRTLIARGEVEALLAPAGGSQ